MEAGLNRFAKSHWERTILVCSKCSKRIDGGFGNKDKTPLAKALRRYLGIRRWRKAKVGIVEVKCLGICPRGAVTLVDAANPDRWRIVPKGVDMAELADALDLAPPDSQTR